MGKVSQKLQFVCPIDGLPLAKEGNSLRCEKKHTYDLAKEGYCNLLLVQQKNSLDPGDNKEMVAARRRFLDGGFYAPIAEKLSTLVSSITGHTGFSIADAGCGEGYYLDYLNKAGHYNLAGFDISKWAVQAAAKRNPRLSWAVASNRKIPFAPGSVDLILSLFGFPLWDSFRKVLGKEGLVLLVDPAPGHLLELRKIIYPVVNATELYSLREAEASGFRLAKEEVLNFSISLNSQEQIQDLLAMTPHAHRIGQEGREALGKLRQLTVTAEVVLRVIAV
ncbi:MAG: putative RNA methyltransferase [Bacteriovoracia bacterium]